LVFPETEPVLRTASTCIISTDGYIQSLKIDLSYLFMAKGSWINIISIKEELQN